MVPKKGLVFGKKAKPFEQYYLRPQTGDFTEVALKRPLQRLPAASSRCQQFNLPRNVKT
jgi:hypothetical protein